MNFQTRAERQKFYKSSHWQILRQWVLSRDPLCELCITKDRITPGTECHHKIDIADRPDLRLDPKNIQVLCQTCHNTISSETDAKMQPVQLKHTLEDQLQNLNKPKK